MIEQAGSRLKAVLHLHINWGDGLARLSPTRASGLQCSLQFISEFFLKIPVLQKATKIEFDSGRLALRLIYRHLCKNLRNIFHPSVAGLFPNLRLHFCFALLKLQETFASTVSSGPSRAGSRDFGSGSSAHSEVKSIPGHCRFMVIFQNQTPYCFTS